MLWVVVYGQNAADIDKSVANEIYNCLKRKALYVKLIPDTQYKQILHHRFFNVVSVGGGKVNVVSRRYMAWVSPTLVEMPDGKWCLKDDRGKICHCNNWKAGTVGVGQKTLFTKVYLIQGIGRLGTVAAKNAFIDMFSRGNIQGKFVFYHSDTEYGVQNRCWEEGAIRTFRGCR